MKKIILIVAALLLFFNLNTAAAQIFVPTNYTSSKETKFSKMVWYPETNSIEMVFQPRSREDVEFYELSYLRYDSETSLPLGTGQKIIKVENHEYILQKAEPGITYEFLLKSFGKNNKIFTDPDSLRITIPGKIGAASESDDIVFKNEKMETVSTVEIRPDETIRIGSRIDNKDDAFDIDKLSKWEWTFDSNEFVNCVTQIYSAYIVCTPKQIGDTKIRLKLTKSEKVYISKEFIIRSLGPKPPEFEVTDLIYEQKALTPYINVQWRKYNNQSGLFKNNAAYYVLEYESRDRQEQLLDRGLKNTGESNRAKIDKVKENSIYAFWVTAFSADNAILKTTPKKTIEINLIVPNKNPDKSTKTKKEQKTKATVDITITSTEGKSVNKGRPKKLREGTVREILIKKGKSFKLTHENIPIMKSDTEFFWQEDVKRKKSPLKCASKGNSITCTALHPGKTILSGYALSGKKNYFTELVEVKVIK